MTSIINKYPFFEGENVTRNAVTYEKVNRRDAYVLANAVTKELYRPDVYSGETILKLIKMKKPTDPYTRRPIVRPGERVRGAVVPIRAPKALRKLMEAMNSPTGSKSKTKVSVGKKERPVVKPVKKQYNVKVTMYLAEGRGSYMNGVRLNNDPFVTPWENVKKVVVDMINFDISKKLFGSSAGFALVHHQSKKTNLSEIKVMVRLDKEENPKSSKFWNEKGVYTKTFNIRMFEKGHSEKFKERDCHLRTATLADVKKGLMSPRSASVSSKLEIPK